MGLQQSKPDEAIKQKQSQSKSYYGGILIDDHKSKTSYQHFTVQQEGYTNFLKIINQRQSLYHQNFITLNRYWRKAVDKSSFICAADERIQIVIEYPLLQSNLSSILDKMYEKNQRISQFQLRRIFFSVLKCLIYLKSKQTCHGDIKSLNILFDNLGNVKLLDSYFINGGKTSFEIVMQRPDSMSLLSPEQLEILKDKNFNKAQDVYNNQIWALALTMYQCMTFEVAMECYDLDKLIVRPNYFDGKQQICRRNGYSQSLILAVMNLIKKPSKQRISFEQFYDILRNFS